MQLLDGRAVAKRIRESVRERISAERLTPGLGVVLVGTDPASHTYVERKEEACAEVGIRFTKVVLPATTPQPAVIEAVERFNADPAIHAILVQLPLPAPIDEDAVIRAIDPRKDVDGFHPRNVRAFVDGNAALTPVLVKALWSLLEETRESLAEKTATILSNAEVFARPIVAYLGRHGIAAAYVAPGPNAREQISTADILIVALGKPKSITSDDVKPGAIVLDVGTTKIGNQWVGDVDADAVKDKASWLTPVPGGVGPVTVAMLLTNVVDLTTKKNTNIPLLTKEGLGEVRS